MDRDIVYTTEQLRSWDFAIAEFYAMSGLGRSIQDILGSTITVLGGLAGTATGSNLVVHLAAGAIYQQAQADATAVGAIEQNTTVIEQQGIIAASTVTLSTAGITGGQSRYTLIQAQFAQLDNIPADDPGGGSLAFFNSGDPTSPLYVTENTRRQGAVIIGTKNGAASTTGSEVPPNPDAGWVPLYLIDLAFGQTTISTGSILTAGPSVGLNVPSNYTRAPFLAGLLSSHHGGTLGQAPKVNLATEVQGLLPNNQVAGFGSYGGLSFESGNYTTQASDLGTVVELAATASGPATFKVIDATFVGASINFVNQSAFNLTITRDTGSSAQFIGVGVPLATSFIIPAGGNAEIIWGGVNWRVNDFSGAFAGSGTVGSYAGVSFQSASYTTVAADIGTVLSLAAAASGAATFTVIDGTFQGAAILLINQSNFPLTMQIVGGSTANFVGVGIATGTSFVIPAGGAAQIVWGSLNWRVPYFAPTAVGNFGGSVGHTATDTVLTSDFGKQHVFGSATPASQTLSIPDGVVAGDTVIIFNNSAFAQTVARTGGASGTFIGAGLAAVTSFSVPSKGSVQFVWGGINWLVSFLTPGGFSSSASLTATSFWTQEPDGTIVQGGSGTLAAGTDTITFPIAFPTGPYKASFKAGPRATGINSNTPVSADHTSPTTTGATVWGATGATTPYWYEIRGK